MKYKGTEDIKLNNTVVTVGKFDCFHKGHQLIFRVASEMKKPGMEQVIFMFDTNPGDVVKQRKGKYIVAQKERKPLSKRYGVDHCIEYPFTESTRNMSPEEFVSDVLVKKLGIKACVAGDDFRFGKDRAGDTDTLIELGKKYGFEVEIVKRISYKGRIISSTLIRERLLEGDIEEVNQMLGRPYSISGLISKGNHVGSANEVPTINFQPPEDKLLPPDGVYATKTLIDGKEYISITNIGVRPTFYEESDRYIETFILDFSGDLYGKNAEVCFYRFVRPEKKFENSSALYEQISKDITETRKYFSGNKTNE